MVSMGKIYKQLGISKRERIMVLHSLGWSHGRISCDIGRSKSTVTREIQLNREPGGGLYSAWDAARRSRKRKQNAGRRERLKEATVRLYVRKKLEQGWTPELIAGWFGRHGTVTVSYEAIYQWIYADAPELIGCLRRRHRQADRGAG